MTGRATSLSPPERFLLEQWARSLMNASRRCDARPCPYPYLVGSVARGESWRDVDVRLMLPADQFVALTGGSARRLATLNVSFSLWGQRATDRPSSLA